MSQSQEEDLYTPARYLAVISVVDYQGEVSVNDIDFYAHAETSLEPEADSLENLGILQEENGFYTPSERYREDIEELGEFVQITENGEWKDIELSERDQRRLEEDRTNLIGWIT